ncbi:MAG: DUF4468 domain-containing protein [Flavobacteriales bacterium]|jgi:hypothetical protein|nr:DUF4468 domain-containing protein [Flavobacteriales bacterium]
MKKLILISLFTSTIAFSQVPKLELTSKGIEPVIINVDMKQASAIYAKTIEWLENSYEKPDDVIFENVENRKLGIKDVEKTVWIANRIGVDVNYDMEYTLKIEFKDDRIRISYELGSFLKDGKKLTTNYKDLFKKFDGSVKYNYDGAVAGIENKLNAKTQSLNNFIMGVNDGEDW